ncbi:MAG: DUF1080 domain-containing protein [Verrucomicrobiales bacterium]|nr:DUF1080 domain-containing protein [Verrucomicrobiales bacterium]
MRLPFFLPALLFAGLLAPLSALAEDGFVPLFNGKDFSGWTNVNCAPSTWSFNEEGLLVCTGKPIGEIRTERMYQNFILELEWRHLVPKGNAGVFVWADDITAKGQPFIRGVEIQVLENAYGNTKSYTTHGDIFPIHGAKMKPTNGRGGVRSFPTEFLSNPSPEWNHYRIECNDGTIKLWVNGTKVNEGRECLPKKGYICLESEGGVVHYRNVRIKELPDTPVTPEETAIADRGYETFYNGVDLSGWQRSSDRWKAKDWNLVFTEKPNSDQGGFLISKDLSVHSRIIFDIRFLSDSGSLSLYPAGLERQFIKFDPNAPKDPPEILTTPYVSKALEKPGKWNRVEIHRMSNGLKMKVNGIDSLEWLWDVLWTLETPTPFAFSTNSPLEMANFYIKDESSPPPAKDPFGR